MNKAMLDVTDVDDETCSPEYRRARDDRTVLLDPDSLDALLRDPMVPWRDLVGRLSETWVTQPGVGYPIVAHPVADPTGVAIKVDDFPCCCGREATTLYLVTGLHYGAFCYVEDAAGNYLANLRDQSFVCDADCQKRRCSTAPGPA